MFTEKELYILNWIRKVSEVREELNGFAICPFAAKSKFKIVECSAEEISPIEDVSFCLDAKEAGFEIWCDPRIRVGHEKTRII